MRKLPIFVGIALSALALTGNRLAAFPLTLTSISGTITATPYYGLDATTTSNVALNVSVSLSQVITVLSNEVFLDVGTNPPANLRIALDPFTSGLYLTNRSGFFYDLVLNGLGSFRIRDVATTFNRTNLNETDAMLVDLSFNGRQPHGGNFQLTLRGRATFTCARISSAVKAVTLYCPTGAGYGEFHSSSSGVSRGTFKATGSGTPEWDGPFSVFWWNH